MVLEKYQTRKVLILGTTYPSYSSKYWELACTGGVFSDSLEMVRLHPVPLRYLEREHQFKKFQWIEAKVTKNTSDPRPESFRVKPDSIRLLNVIPPESREERRSYLEQFPHFCSSVEELLDRQKTSETSLGIVRPQEVLDCEVVRRSEAERRDWEEKERNIMDQQVMFAEKPKKIDFPEAKFYVIWKCNDPRCKSHRMSLLQWGIHELYRKMSREYPQDKAREKVRERMLNDLDMSSKDVFLFLGSFRGTMFNFGLMDSYSPLKGQMEMFL